MADRVRLQEILSELEAEMKLQALWEQNVPPASAFESSLPFFYDTMNFAQWLQWVFVARFNALFEGDHPLPASCEVAPMAEEYFKDLEIRSIKIVELLKEFDDQFN